MANRLDNLPIEMQSRIYKYIFDDVINEIPVIEDQDINVTDEMERDMVGYNEAQKESYLNLYRRHFHIYLSNYWLMHLRYIHVLTETNSPLILY